MRLLQHGLNWLRSHATTDTRVSRWLRRLARYWPGVRGLVASVPGSHDWEAAQVSFFSLQEEQDAHAQAAVEEAGPGVALVEREEEEWEEEGEHHQRATASSPLASPTSSNVVIIDRSDRVNERHDKRRIMTEHESLAIFTAWTTEAEGRAIEPGMVEYDRALMVRTDLSKPHYVGPEEPRCLHRVGHGDARTGSLWIGRRSGHAAARQGDDPAASARPAAERPSLPGSAGLAFARSGSRD